jgi:hypothetical protein
VLPVPAQPDERVHHHVLGVGGVVDQVPSEPDQVGVVRLEHRHHAVVPVVGEVQSIGGLRSRLSGQHNNR